jgi:hypothetical protein
VSKTSPWGKAPEISFEIDPAPACPGCGEILSGATAVDLSGRAPKSGDVTICLYCTAVLEFVNNEGALNLALVHGDELILALANPKIRKARQVILANRALRLPDRS